MDRTLRIKANVGKDQVLHLNMKQNIDMFEILSLSLSQNDVYKIHSSNYGVIVGRVLANDAFGVPNAKVSVFIPLSDEDALSNDIKELYPYTSVSSVDSENRRYNLLPSYSDSNDECYSPVGTFPSKRLVLDEDTVLEIYDKYYKYTATTNKAGDYMIFGVPTGNTQIHVDVDLSNIGILSQKPRDFVYKGYNINQFESPTKFKSGTTLDNLSQIFGQSESITVYPFWSDSDAAEAAITRKDINLQYQFETTCVFLGSVITDSKNNNITHTCDVEADAGKLSQMTTGEGTIEMIRKTPYGEVEEKSIQGNQLINSDGVWCYQIPMNLDYVGMDEYGNIVPTNDPTKGIPTRTRVRFRISMSESGTETLTRHKAKYLVPNNPFTYPKGGGGDDKMIPVLSGLSKTYYDNFYEFGTLTPDCCFRDLMWNCVYTVKNFIPRIQRNEKVNNEYYSGIKGVNYKDASDKNIFPYNKIKIYLNLRGSLFAKIIYDDRRYWEDFWNYITHRTNDYQLNEIYEDALEESDAVSLDFYNDWVNGVLYFPLWFWRRRKKKKYKSGETVYDSQFCNAKDDAKGLYELSTCELPYKIDDDSETHSIKLDIENEEYYPENRKRKKRNYKLFQLMQSLHNFDKIGHSFPLAKGIIKEKTNKDGANIYYYLNSQKTCKNGKCDDNNKEREELVRLYSTDIVLLGSLVDDDINGIPQITDCYPITSSNVPPMGTYKAEASGTLSLSDDVSSVKTYEYDRITGMNWGLNVDSESDDNGFKFRRGLFFGLFDGWRLVPLTLPKSCINLERICELGVSLDMSTAENVKETNTIDNFGINDGLITKREIEDEYGRQLFATLNRNPLIVDNTIVNPITGYYNYSITYSCPTDFNGSMDAFANGYTNGYTFDDESHDYEAFRYGGYKTYKFHQYVNNKNDISYYYPAYDNSYYFYFGLNPGTTAIEEFKKNFYSTCVTEIPMPFNLTVNIISTPTVCDLSGGTLQFTSNNLFKDQKGCLKCQLKNTYGDIIDKCINDSDNIMSGITEGSYTLSVSGYSNCTNVNECGGTFLGTMEETINIDIIPMSVSYNVNWSNADNYGSIIISNFNMYGKDYSNFEYDESTGKISISYTSYKSYLIKENMVDGSGTQRLPSMKDGKLVYDKLEEGHYKIQFEEYCDGNQIHGENKWTKEIYVVNPQEEENTETETTTENG